METKIEKVAFINQESGYFTVDILNSFQKNGCKTVLISGNVNERKTKLHHDIKIERISRYGKRNSIIRIKSWILSSIQILFKVKLAFRDWHLFITTNPPIAPLLPLLLKNNFSLLIFDVFPNALIDFGVIKKGSIINKIWTGLNRRVYKRASNIFVLTDGMKEALSHYVSAEKVTIIPLWTNNNFIKPILKNNNPFIKEHKLEGKFIVLYSGNFGLAHHLDVIIDLAFKCTDERVLFVIIGGGPAENRLKQRHSKLGLKNCILLPWQDNNNLPYSLAAADLSIVTLSENASKLGLPSKLFSYISTGSPILGITGAGSDLEKIILNYNLGKSFEADKLTGMIDYIGELVDNPSLYEFYRNNSLRASQLHSEENVGLITMKYV